MNLLNRLTAVCLALPCLAASARAEPYDARITDEEWILKKTLEDGSLVYGFFNLSGDVDRTIKMNARGLENMKARDLWRQKDIGILTDTDSFAVQVGPLGCAVVRFSGQEARKP